MPSKKTTNKTNKKAKRVIKELQHFPGFKMPAYTSVPDDVFDKVMCYLNGAELKVLLFIIRRTFGFKKESDDISIGQIMKGIKSKDSQHQELGTGLARSTALEALQTLERHALITRERKYKRDGGLAPTNYKLNLQGIKKENSQDAGESVTENQTPLVRNSGLPPSAITDQLVQASGPASSTQPDKQDTIYQNNKNVLADLWKKPPGKINTGQLLRIMPDLDISKEIKEAIADFIVSKLKDGQNSRFYLLVAGKIPEREIRRILSEIEHDGGAKNPAKVFTHAIKLYAIYWLKNQMLGEMT